MDDRAAEPAAHHSLAVLVSGMLRSEPRRHEGPLTVNPFIERSPLQTWHALSQATFGRVSIFACTNVPLPSSVQLAGQWVFESPSQFARLLSCLRSVEPDLSRPRHTAYLRLRPDALVLGGLPRQLLRAPEPDAVYTRWRVYSVSFARQQLRDAMECGVCDQWCECAQRKYGQVLFHTNGSDCGVPTDRVFLFGQRALLPVARALLNYSDPSSEHPARSPLPHRDHCVDAGRMVEVGFGRVLEDQGLRLLPLPFRTTLARELRNETPSWEAKACMLAWGDEPRRCDEPCFDPSWRSTRARTDVVGRGPWISSGPWQGCNPVNKC